jgi:hypothetical protein
VPATAADLAIGCVNVGGNLEQIGEGVGEIRHHFSPKLLDAQIDPAGPVPDCPIDPLVIFALNG